MTNEIKTYSSKSNAKRAAKSQDLDLDMVEFVEQESGRWVIEMTLPAKKEAPIHYVDGPVKIERRRVSEVEKPCNLVWEICEEMKGARRKDVIEACVKQGIAYNTARTQYQQWLVASRNSEK